MWHAMLPYCYTIQSSVQKSWDSKEKDHILLYLILAQIIYNTSINKYYPGKRIFVWTYPHTQCWSLLRRDCHIGYTAARSHQPCRDTARYGGHRYVLLRPERSSHTGNRYHCLWACSSCPIRKCMVIL